MITLYIYIAFTILFMIGAVISEYPTNSKDFVIAIIVIIFAPIFLPLFIGFDYKKP